MYKVNRKVRFSVKYKWELFLVVDEEKGFLVFVLSFDCFF